jgi:hypothetical protein
MHALLLTCLVLLGAETRSIFNSMNLIHHDWSVAESTTENIIHQASGRFMGTRSVRSCQMLSFREDESTWTRGTVWKIECRNSEGSFSAVAFKGSYLIRHRDEQDVLVITLGFTKKYQTSGLTSAMSTASWSLDTRFLPQGGHFVLTLDPGNCVPESALELSFEQGFYCNEQGQETVLRYSPSTLSERIMGAGSVRTLRSPEFGTLGETWELVRGDVFQQDVPLKMPPTFRPLIYSPEPHVVMKPTASTPSLPPSPQGADPAEAIFAKAKEAHEKADYRRAITLYTAALELSPSLTSAIKWRGYAYYQLKEYVQAGRDLSEVIKRDPSDASAYLKRAEAYFQLGYISRGVADYTERVRLSPKDPYAFNSLAWVLATCSDSSVRNGKLALVHAEKACQLTDFKNAFCIGTLAAACAETGDFDRALRLQTVALELHSDSRKPQAIQLLRSYENRKPWHEHPREGL